MRVGIDAHILGKGIGGVERVVEQIIRLVPDLLPTDEFIVFTERNYVPTSAPRAHVTFVPLAIGDPLLQRSILLPVLARRHRLDLLHVQRIAPPAPGCPVIAHLHDILPLTHPREHRGFRNALVRLLSPGTIRRAAGILTVSDSARAQIVQRFPKAAGKVTAIFNGIDHAFFRPAAAGAARGSVHARLGLGAAPYLLYLGAITPRKNLEVVLRGFRAFLGDADKDTKLVLAGMVRTGDYARNLVKLTASLDLGAQVCFAGFIADADCLALLQHAQVFLAPSLGEGFDLPALEAMACGVPVIASDIDVHRELIPDSSLLFDPARPEALATALRQLWHDTNARLLFGRRSAESASKFDWQNMARQLADVYQRVAAKSL